MRESEGLDQKEGLVYANAQLGQVQVPRYGIASNSGLNKSFRLHTWACVIRPALLYGWRAQRRVLDFCDGAGLKFFGDSFPHKPRFRKKRGTSNHIWNLGHRASALIARIILENVTNG